MGRGPMVPQEPAPSLLERHVASMLNLASRTVADKLLPYRNHIVAFWTKGPVWAD
jgi:hypothetical protein